MSMRTRTTIDTTTTRTSRCPPDPTATGTHEPMRHAHPHVPDAHHTHRH